MTVWKNTQSACQQRLLAVMGNTNQPGHEKNTELNHIVHHPWNCLNTIWVTVLFIAFDEFIAAGSENMG